MHSTPQPPTAAGEHFADAKRIIALPLVKRPADRDRHVQVALVRAVLTIPPASSTPAKGTPPHDEPVTSPIPAHRLRLAAVVLPGVETSVPTSTKRGRRHVRSSCCGRRSLR
jgi:hypothetical protein